MNADSHADAPVDARRDARDPKDGASVGELCSALNVSRETVREWRNKGWLVWAPSRRYYDVEQTRQRVILMRDPRGGKAGGPLANLEPPKPKPRLTKAQAEAIRNIPPELADLAPDVIARRLKIAQMLQAEHDEQASALKLAKAKGEQVEVGPLKLLWFNTTRSARDAALGCGSRVASQLVATVLSMADRPAEAAVSVESMIAADLRDALRALKEDVAPGVAE